MTKDLADSSHDATEHFSFDCTGNLVQYTDANLHNTTFAYTDNFSTTAPQVTYAYRTSITLPNGAPAVARKYNVYSGKVVQETDPNSLVTTFAYQDALNRLTQISRAGEGTVPANTNVVYSDSPQAGAEATSVLTYRDQFGSSVRRQAKTSYDALGRAVKVTEYGADTIETATIYDGDGRVYQRCNPKQVNIQSDTDGCTTYSYDALSRVTAINNPDGSISSMTYTSQGPTEAAPAVARLRLTTATDEALTSRTMQYDGLDRLVGVTDASGSTAYSYDALDNLTGVSQGTQTRQFTYDSLKRLKTATNPETGTISYTYDGGGNLVTKTVGTVITCFGILTGTTCDKSGYDAMNRPTHITYSDGATPEVWNCYDGKTYSGGVCTTTAAAQQWLRKTGTGNSVSSTNYSFDKAGRLNTSAQNTGVSYSFAYEYYNDDSPASVQYPSGRKMVTCYDRNGRITWVSQYRTTANCTAGTGGTTAAYGQVTGYSPAGGITSMTLGNGLVESTTYNSRLQPTAIQAGALLKLQYDYVNQQSGCTANTPGRMNNGNVQQQTITRGAQVWTQSYCYGDGLNRLTQAYEGANWKQNYGYDRFGNRWVAEATGLPGLTLETPVAASWYGTDNRILGWGYDTAGNVTQVGGMLRSFAYDAENRQKTATVAGITTGYGYDGNGQRVTKNVNGSTTTYVYDGGGQLAAEYGSAGEGATKYLTVDALGSTRLVTTAAGGVEKSYDYLPFGEDLKAGTAGRDATFPSAVPPGTDTATKLKPGFTSKERDSETGLDLFAGPLVDNQSDSSNVPASAPTYLSRYYSSAQGRFTSPDQPLLDQNPANPQIWNLYSFVRNNPLSFIDLNGGECTRLPDGPDGSPSYSGDCASPGDEKVTQSDKPQEVNVQDLDPLYNTHGDISDVDRQQQLGAAVYNRATHDLGCAGLGFAFADAGGSLFVSGQPNAGFRSPVSGRLVGGSKPFASGGASAGSSTLSGALREALPQRLPAQIPTPVGGPGTGRAFSIQGSNRLGVVLGRWAPFLGIAGTAYGAYSLNACLSQ